MKRNILLIEPNYKNKYPPIGLMKLSTYHKQIGDHVTFFKGNLREFVLNNIVNDAVKKLNEIDNYIDWNSQRELIHDFIQTGKHDLLSTILVKQLKYTTTFESWLIHYKDFYKKGKYKLSPQWDRICITTLFTFYYKQTIETINFAKNLVKDINELFIGGVMASVMPIEIEQATGIKPHIGLLNEPGVFDDNDIIIDHLPLDYSIIDEIDYKYLASNAFYGYSTRGCIRRCSFCAVPIIEPKFESYISISNQITHAKELYGDKQNLLLLDNNVLASKNFPEIIDDIKRCGFEKGSLFVEPNYLEIYIKNLKKKINDIAYIKCTSELYINLLRKLKGEEKQYVYEILNSLDLLNIKTVTKQSLIRAYPLLRDYFEKYRNKFPKHRRVDFNQGIDARLLTRKNVKLLSGIAINPLRIAFDSMAYKDIYIQAINLCAEHEIKSLSNYLLYNEKDKPIDLYQRLQINVELSNQLSVNIYSFPMKYHPIFGKFNINRDYIGEYWNRKFIRAIQAILNATKGKIGKSKSFFYKAFGETEEEFKQLLYMPEPYILYRFFFEEMGYPQKWSKEFLKLNENELLEAKCLIEKNEFKKDNLKLIKSKNVRNFYHHYLITSGEVLENDTSLGKLKVMYDETGTVFLPIAKLF